MTESGKLKVKAMAGNIPVYCAHDAIVNTDEVQGNPKNPNQHPDDQVALLAKVIKKQGWRAPITISTLSGLVVRGHGRLMAAKRLGTSAVPVDYQDYESEADEYADLIADNRLAELANLDNRMLLDLMADIEDLGGDTSLTAYSEEELTRMINQISGAGDTVPIGEDDVIEPPAGDPVTRPGDLWLLGPHRVLCGDATSAKDVAYLMDSELASLIFTDPPYGISYVATSDKFGGSCILGDDKTEDDLIISLLAPAFKLAARHSTDSAGFYIWHAYQTRKEYEYSLEAAGLKERQYLTWVKPHMVLGWSHWRWQSEPCFYASKAGFEPAFYGDRANSAIWYVTQAEPKDVTITLGGGIAVMDGQGGKLVILPSTQKNKKLRHIRLTKKDQVLHVTRADDDSTVWEVGRDGGHEHPTQKPVELGRRAIENGTNKGEIVLDLFLGSGSTLIGAEITGRACYGTELDPKFCDVIVSRWERYTGRKAERIPAEKTWEPEKKVYKASEIDGQIIKGQESITVEFDAGPLKEFTGEMKEETWDPDTAPVISTPPEKKPKKTPKKKPQKKMDQEKPAQNKLPATEEKAIEEARKDGVPF